MMEYPLNDQDNDGLRGHDRGAIYKRFEGDTVTPMTSNANIPFNGSTNDCGEYWSETNVVGKQLHYSDCAEKDFKN